MAGLATVLAGVLFIVAEPLTLLMGRNSLGEIYRDVRLAALTPAFFIQSVLAFVAAMLLLGGLVGLYACQAEAAGKLGLVGFLVAFLCTALLLGDFYADVFVTRAVTIAAPRLFDTDFAGVLRIWFPIEFGFLGLGWLLFAIGTLKARVYPRGAALLLVVGAVLAVLPLPLIAIVFDSALVWLGLALMKERNSRVGQRRTLRHRRGRVF